jgi:hypothetical protein
VVAAKGGDFSYKPEKKDGKNFVEQKWGWSASKPGEGAIGIARLRCVARRRAAWRSAVADLLAP